MNNKFETIKPFEETREKKDSSRLEKIGSDTANALMEVDEAAFLLTGTPEKEYTNDEINNANEAIADLPSDFSPEIISDILNKIDSFSPNYLSNLLFLTKTYLKENNTDEKIEKKANELFQASLNSNFDPARAKSFYQILENLL
jgi:hypothetical protein